MSYRTSVVIGNCIVVALIAGLVLLGVLKADDKNPAAQQPAPKQPAPQPQPQERSPAPQQGEAPHANPQQPARPGEMRTQGRVITKGAHELQRHQNPVTQPPIDHRHLPPPHRGHHWRYHPHFHRYVLVPVHVSPNVVVLPPSFQLPPQVTIYEAAPLGCEIICPHCQRQIGVQVFAK